MKRLLKKLLPRPFLRLYQSWRYHLAINRNRFRGKTVAQIFAEIHEAKYWQGGQSISGPGSDPPQTETIRRELPRLLKKHGIRSLLDIPCGDFNWMQHVDLQEIRYTGADVVEGLVQQNTEKFATPNRAFQTLDLMNDPLPQADLILVRDCLVHFSFAHIQLALQNMKRSGSRFLLATSFSGNRKNTDIHTGGWRPLNFQKPPFNFPPPLEIIVENCTEAEGAYADKCLMLWELKKN